MEGRGFRDLYRSYEERGVEIFGISNDPVRRNASFAQKENLPFLLLSDLDGRIGTAYGAMGDEHAKSENRITYVVGPDGKVLHAWEKVKAAGHAEEVLGSLGR